MAVGIRAIAAAGLLVGVLQSAALADGWSVGASLSTMIQYDDNPLLRSNEDSVWGFIISPEMTVMGETPRTSLKIDLRLDVNQFSGSGVQDQAAEDLDSFDQHFTSDFELHSKHSSLGANVAFDRDTTRTSEITDSGILSDNARRESLQVDGKDSRRASSG